jgi:anti-sigma factor RsiW
MSPTRLLHRDLACREVVELITDYLDDVLPRRQRTRLEAHLRACDGCDEYLRQFEATIRVLGAVELEDLEPETREGLIDLYRRFTAET